MGATTLTPATETAAEPPEHHRRRAIARRLLRPQMLWTLVLIGILVWLIVIPLITVVMGSFRTTPPGVPGPYTTEKYVEAYTNPRLLQAIKNTLYFAVGSSALAMGLGCYLAWVTERTNAPGRRLIYAFVLIPIIVPGILTTIAWVLTLNERIGLANHMLGFFGVDHPVFDAYTIPAMIWVEGTDSITLPFLLMAAAFRAMDPSLEEASSTSGATRGYTLRHVTLPLATPAILATLLIVFVKAVENFETPAIMGLPGRISVFSTEVWLATQKFPTDRNLGAAFAVGYMVLSLGGLALYYKATGISEKFATITGKGYKPVRMDLGRRRFLHASIAMFILGVSVLVPFVVMIYASLLPFYSTPDKEAFSSMSLDNYTWALHSPSVYHALQNNLIAGGGAAIVAMVLAALIAWVVIRTKLPGRKLLDGIAFAPIALPGIVIGLALVWFYLSVPIPVYATLWIIGIGFVTAYLPYALRATHASLSQVGKELEEAAATCGASFQYTFRTVIMPLISSGLLVGFIYVFSRSFKGLSLPIMLAGPGTETLPVLVFDLYNGGSYTELNALGVLMFLFLLVLSVLAQQLSKRFGHVDNT